MCLSVDVCVCVDLFSLMDPLLFLFSLSSLSLSLFPPYIGGCELQRQQNAVRIPVCADVRRRSWGGESDNLARSFRGVDLFPSHTHMQ